MTLTFSPWLNHFVKPPAKQPHLAAGYDAFMDVFAIRLGNLRALTSGLGRGERLQRDVATDLDLSASYLSQLIGGKKMGEDVARKIEVAQKLPLGWMDQTHDSVAYDIHVREPVTDYGLSQLLRIDPETIAAALKLVRLSFRNLKTEFDPEQDGTPLAYAYEYLITRRERAVTAENVIDFSARIEKKRLEREDANQESAGHYRSTGRGNS